MSKNIAELLAEEAEASEVERDADLVYTRHRRPAKDPAQVFSLRIPVNRLAQLRKLAEARHASVGSLLRSWILERLEAEASGAVVMNPDEVRKIAHLEFEKLLSARVDEIREVLEREAQEPRAKAHPKR